MFRRTLIFISLSWLLVLVVAPHLLVLISSFMTRNPEHLVVWPANLDSYRRLLDPLYLQVFLDSFKLALITSLITLLIGFPFAWWLSKFPKSLRYWLLFLLILPFWTNSLIRTYAIKIILGRQGLVNQGLQALGITDQPIQLLYTDFAVVLGLVYLLLPFMILPLYNSFDKLDGSLLEAAKDLGANAWQRLLRVILPLTAPGIVAGALMVFLPAMGMFYVADLLGGAKQLLLGNLIKDEFLVNRDWPFGSALSMLMILIMAAMLLVYNLVNKRLDRKGGLDDTNL